MNSAYEILSDKDKRGQYDRGEIDGDGKPRMHDYAGFGGAGARPGSRGFSGFDGDTIFESFTFGPDGQRGHTRRGRPESFDDIGDIFGFGRQKRSAGGGFTPRRGPMWNSRSPWTWKEAAQGASKRFTLPSGKQVDLKVPPAPSKATGCA